MQPANISHDEWIKLIELIDELSDRIYKLEKGDK